MVIGGEVVSSERDVPVRVKRLWLATGVAYARAGTTSESKRESSNVSSEPPPLPAPSGENSPPGENPADVETIQIMSSDIE